LGASSKIVINLKQDWKEHARLKAKGRKTKSRSHNFQILSACKT
jgi:hypothetical protein